MQTVFVPGERFVRFVRNYEASHGPATFACLGQTLTAISPDGATFAAELPFSEHEGDDTAAESEILLDLNNDPASQFLSHLTIPQTWGILVARKGGFAAVQLAGTKIVSRHIGRRHVQGRSAAGGQSQQRFARRRRNQARASHKAAADHAADVLGHQILTGQASLVVGGDKDAIRAILADPRMQQLRIVGPFLGAAQPRRALLEQAIAQSQALTVTIDNG